jgi:VanZ family protein
MNRTESVVQWAEAIAWMVLIFSLSGDSFQSSRTLIALQYWIACLDLRISAANIVLLHGVLRKVAHVAEFFVLGVLLYRALSGKLAAFRVKAVCWVLVSGLLLAPADEFRQILADHRTPSIRDSVLDFAGVVASQLWILLRTALSPGVLTGKDAGREGSVQPSRTKGSAPRGGR